MIYDTGEYNVKLEIPTDNFVFYDFLSSDIDNLDDYIFRITNKLRDKKTLIILFGGFQNLHEIDYVFDRLNKLTNEIPNPIIAFNGRLTANASNTVKPLFAYHRICLFDHVSNINIHSDITLHTNKNYKCYWASSKDVYPRRFILAGLIKNTLLKDSLVNYKCVHSQIPSDWLESRFESRYIKFIKQECDSISNLVPLPSLDDTIEFNCTDPQFYLNSYLGIITDTFYDSGVFLSEKIFNAINYYQLFFYVGPAGSLQALRDRGYNTFDSIIDTRYDKIKNNALRLIMARNSLLKFLNRPIDKIQADYLKCTSALEHNKKLLQSQRPDLLVTEYIQNLLDEHRKANSNIS